MWQANASIPVNSLEQYVYSIQEVYVNTNVPRTLVQRDGGGSNSLGNIDEAIGAGQG